MASYFILGLIEIFMLCFNEIKLEGGGLRGWRSGLKGAAQMRWAFCWLLADEALAAPGKNLMRAAQINVKLSLEVI